MKNVILKRISAYLIDAILVATLIGLVSQIPFINPYIDRYNDAYQKIIKLEKSYSNKKITKKQYTEQYITLNKKLDNYNFPSSIMSVAIFFGYFVMFQYFNKGQTLGKKLMKIRIKCNKKGELSFSNYLIRSLILNGILVSLISIILLLTTSNKIYYYSSTGVTIVESAFIYATLITMLFRKDNRGLHDIITNTKVVPINDNSKVIDI